MVKEKALPSGGGGGGTPQSESKTVGSLQMENDPSAPPQHRAKSPVMSNPPVDQNSSKSTLGSVGQKVHNNENSNSSNSKRDVDRVGSVVNDFQSVSLGSASAHEQALQQQALHQAALHQQALKQHGIGAVSFHSLIQQPNSSRLCQQSKQHTLAEKCVKAEPIDVSDLDKFRAGHEVIEIDDSKGRRNKVEHEQALQGQSQSTLREGVFADLNAEPPLSDGGEEHSHSGGDKITATQHESGRSTNDEKRKKKNFVKVKKMVKDIEEQNKKVGKPGKACQKLKGDPTLESGHDTDPDQQYLGVLAAREEKIKSLKSGLVHVARKMPKNAHAHFVLGLMYQRMGQPTKAVSSYEKSTEILTQSEEETGQSRVQLLSLVQIHHAQCLLQGSVGDHCTLDKELQKDEIEDVVCKLKESVQADDRHASVWNTLGLLLLRTGRVQSAVSVLSSLLSIVPDYLDALANLGVAYLHSGDLEYAAQCFQALLGKDKNHPGALLNYGALLLRQYGSIVAGAGARGSQEVYVSQLAAASAAQQCLAAAVKADSKAGYIWVNLAAAYSLAGDHTSAGRCLDLASKLEPNRMSIRYAVAVHRVKDAERSKDPTQQLSWAANEMASILREADPATVQPCLAWAGLAMVDRAQHETAAGFEGETDLKEVEERAIYTLQQAIEEDPADSVQWHQLGLHTLRTLQFNKAESYLKTAIACLKNCSFAWSNLGTKICRLSSLFECCGPDENSNLWTVSNSNNVAPFWHETTPSKAAIGL
ncbi:uncharacterized protein LOC131075077 isoform X2 [Cryptomeria japonica]|uniref:uncharacterized protein LOC131075077 isoform X2 n=1 Tax=Cryptomeria japonica TaxID=3369 RepID=UPI0027D9CED8|nr:uncharacterized protein LOC131075077 isoform X2 [Cryptomeria japonica]